jgi:hypothetical protein
MKMIETVKLDEVKAKKGKRTKKNTNDNSQQNNDNQTADQTADQTVDQTVDQNVKSNTKNTKPVKSAKSKVTKKQKTKSGVNLEIDEKLLK